MKTNTQLMYERHHQDNRIHGFSVLKDERGHLFSKYVGTGKNVLDLGCRDGGLTSFFVKGNSVVGMDIDGTSLERAAKNLGIKTICSDIHGEWDGVGNKFDVVVCGEVLEHLFYPERIIQKAAQHSKKNAEFIGSIPNAYSIKNKIRYIFNVKKHSPLGDPTHINHFSKSEIESLLKKHYENVKIVGLGRFKLLSRIFPSMFAFDLFFVAHGPKCNER